MLKLCGTYAGTEVTEVPNGGDPFTRTTVLVRTGEGRTVYAQASRDFAVATLPEVGLPVELAVWPRPYVQRDKDKLGCGFTVYAVASSPALV